MQGGDEKGRNPPLHPMLSPSLNRHHQHHLGFVKKDRSYHNTIEILIIKPLSLSLSLESKPSPPLLPKTMRFCPPRPTDLLWTFTCSIFKPPYILVV